MKRGIVTIAVGNSYYGNLAYILALSCKKFSDLPVFLVAEKDTLSGLNEVEKTIFSEILYVDNFKDNFKENYLKVKLFLNELTPYDETLFLDADTVAIKNFDSVFLELKFNILFSYHGYYDISQKRIVSGSKGFWGFPQKIVKYHNLKGILPSLSSTFILFNKSEESSFIFKQAQKLYEDKNCPLHKFDNYIPDEYFFNVAFSLSGKELPYSYYYPVFCVWFHKEIKKEELYERFYFLTTGGNTTTRKISDIYNQCVANLVSEKDFYRFKYKDKKIMLKERLLV
jgi:hypothetical protein